MRMKQRNYVKKMGVKFELQTSIFQLMNLRTELP
jgi:hypothetical protein